MSESKCVRIECTATTSGSWLCPTHQDKYEDVLARILRASTPTPETSDHRQQFIGPCECGRPIYGSWRDRGTRCDVCRELAAKPPTLCEWLGDRVSELGRWADVLKEHPPGTWKWRRDNVGTWFLQAPGAIIPTSPRDVVGAVTWGNGPWADTCQMALFTRHPDVKPEPKPAAFPWNPYPEVV